MLSKLSNSIPGIRRALLVLAIGLLCTLVLFAADHDRLRRIYAGQSIPDDSLPLPDRRVDDDNINEIARSTLTPEERKKWLAQVRSKNATVARIIYWTRFFGSDLAKGAKVRPGEKREVPPTIDEIGK